MRPKYGRILSSLLSEMSTELTLLHQHGIDYFKSGRITDAVSIYKRLIEKAPRDAHAHSRLGLCYLLLGDFQRGWPEYEWRLKIATFVPSAYARVPFWKGEPISHAVIVINPEQGFGDAIQFVRYVPFLKAKGCTVILGCHKPLHRLLSGMADFVLTEGDRIPPFHLQTVLLSLPGLFRTTLETIPDKVPYLVVPQNAGREAISVIAAASKSLRVGVVWQGDTHRSISIKQLLPLFTVPHVKFFSLQKGPAVQEIKLLPSGKLIDLDPYLQDFADTAAAIEKLDLVISIDTAVAHLAGALAKPVWTLVSFAPDWRWMLNRDDSPWYPTMRLFRQPKPDDWTSVIARVVTKLTELVQGRSTTEVAPVIKTVFHQR